MKRILAIALALSLAGCAAMNPNATTQQVQAQHVATCGLYANAFHAAVQLRQAGKLNQAQIDQITQIDNQINPLCHGPLPTNSTAEVQQITTAVTTLGVIEGVNWFAKTQGAAK